MRLLSLLLCFFCLNLNAQDEKLARKVFYDYTEALKNRDLKKLLAVMDKNFLEASGGEKHWKEILNTAATDYKGAELTQVEFKAADKKYYARFNLKIPGKADRPLTDDWYQLSFERNQFYLHEFLDDFEPGKKAE
jgi:hypothetical protein